MKIKANNYNRDITFLKGTIFLFMLLVSFPIGRLFEIFFWNAQIINTENVIISESTIKGYTCSYLKIIQQKAQSIINKKNNSDKVFKYIFYQDRILLKLQTQKELYHSLKLHFIRINVFSISYMNEYHA